MDALQPLTVAALIEFLKTQPQDLLVVYSCFSEQCLLEARDIQVLEFGLPRPDGWVHFPRSDKPRQLYLSLPGN